MKKILCLSICLFLMCTGFVFPVNAEESIGVTLNGGAISFDRQPVMQNDRVLVPLRPVFEALGADVYWWEDFQIAGIVKNDIKIFATMVEQEAVVKFVGKSFEEFTASMYDGTNIECGYSDVVMQIIDDAVYIPVRVISEALGVSVDWDDGNKTVVLTCDNDFISDINTDKTFAEQFFALFWKEYVDEANIAADKAASSALIGAAAAYIIENQKTYEDVTGDEFKTALTDTAGKVPPYTNENWPRAKSMEGEMIVLYDSATRTVIVKVDDDNIILTYNMVTGIYAGD